MSAAGVAAPPARAPGVAPLAIAAQLLCAAIVAPWIAERLGAPGPDVRPAGSVLLLLSLPLLVAGAWRVSRRAVGPRRALFTWFAISAACSTAAELHNVVRYVLLGQQPTLPSPGLLILLLGSHPALLVALARTLGWRHEALTLEAVVDALLIVTAGAVVGIQLGYLAPWPVPTGDPAQLLVLLWRALPVVELSLVVLLVVARGRELGYVTSGAMLAGVFAFAAGNFFHGRLALIDQAAAVSSSDVLWALSTIGFATALLGRPGRTDGADGLDDGMGLRGRFVVLATLVAAQGTFTLALRGARSPFLGTLLAVFVLLLAVRGLLELVRQRRIAAQLESSVAEQRALSQTLEHSVADRTAELADAHRALQRMWVLGQELTQELRPQRVLDAFMDAVSDVAGTEAVSVGMVADDDHLRIVAAHGDARPLVGTLVPMHASAMGRVVRENRAWHAPDLAVDAAQVDRTALRVTFAPYGGRLHGALLVVPLHRRNACVGAVALRTPRARTWGAEEVARIEAMADLLSVALANAEAVEGLRQAEWRFRTLFRAAPDAVLTLVAGGRVLEANDCAGELFGSTPAALVDRALAEVVEPQDRAALADALATGFRGQQARVDVRVPRDGLAPRRLEIALTRLPEAEPPTVLLVGRDVTHEHDMHARLVEAERLAAVGELVAGVAHEVNNPLSSISAFAQLLLHDAALGEEQRESVEVVHAEALRAGQVVKDLLAFARRSAPRREPVDLAAIVERVLRLRGYQLASQSVRTEVQLGDAVPPVLGDTRQLQQVVLNLVTNALQAMPDGGTLRVATRARGDDVELEVADTGAGIPPEARSHIFEPFFTTKAEGQGTGLGLSVSYGIVAAHGGTLALAGTSAAGTRFVVTLRASADAAPALPAAAEGAAPARSPLAGLRLLFVDDEPALRQSMETFGRRRGFDVVTAPEGRAALAAMERATFDAVVCDLRMPGMDGAAFYEALRARHPALARRTVIVTGDMMSGPAHFAAGAGPVTLGKPFSFGQLEETVEALVRDGAPAGGR